MPKQNTGSRKGSAQSKDLGPHAVQIEPDAEYMRYLTRLTSSSPELKKGGYIIKQLSINDLEAKNRCQRCDSRCEFPSVFCAFLPDASMDGVGHFVSRNTTKRHEMRLTIDFRIVESLS